MKFLTLNTKSLHFGTLKFAKLTSIPLYGWNQASVVGFIPCLAKAMVAGKSKSVYEGCLTRSFVTRSLLASEISFVSAGLSSGLGFVVFGLWRSKSFHVSTSLLLLGFYFKSCASIRLSPLCIGCTDRQSIYLMAERRVFLWNMSEYTSQALGTLIW